MPNGAESVATKRVAQGLATRIGHYKGYEQVRKKGTASGYGLRKVPKGAKRQYLSNSKQTGYSFGVHQPVAKRNQTTSRKSLAKARSAGSYFGRMATKGGRGGSYGFPGGKGHWVGYKSPSERVIAKGVKGAGMQTSKRFRTGRKKKSA